jgi:predicted AlkP superfamily pyrophosphatase or phosphodiesterase
MNPPNHPSSSHSTLSTIIFGDAHNAVAGRARPSLVTDGYHLGKAMSRIFLIVLLTASSLPTPTASAESDVERVIIISVDSMNNILLFNEYNNPDFALTPNMGALVRNGTAFTRAEAVMPTKTQINHVTIVSGAYADSIGIIGNYVYDVTKKGPAFFQKYDYPWKKPELIKADTIFKAMEREDPDLTSAVVAGKNFVGAPIWADIQVAPAYTSDWAEELGIMKFPEIMLWDSPDEWVMDNTLLVLEEADPDVMLVNLGFLDPVQHSFGHGSMESWAALAWADYQVGRLLQYLTESGKIDSTLLVVTADHGQSNEWKRVPLGRILKSEGISANVVADGSFATIFLRNNEDLQRAVGVIEGLGYADGIWYEEGLDDVRIRTPYTGDIAVSFHPPYEIFSNVRPPFLGIHGGLQQRFVPIVFFGPNVRRGVIIESASLTDIAPTVCEIAGLPLPSDSEGVVLPVIDRSQREAPDVQYKMVEYTTYSMSYIPVIFFFLALVTLVPALILRKDFGFSVLEISSADLPNLVPFLLMTVSVIFAIGSSFYSYIVNLYAIPGIQPDAFLVAMDFGILGSFLISVSLSLIILWYAPLGIRIMLQKLRRRRWRIRAMPYSLLIICAAQLMFTGINLLIKIPYNIAFHVFVLFFFGGLALSYIHRAIVIHRYVEARRRLAMTLTILSGLVVLIFWFYLTMFMLFPNYLYELGIPTIF